MFSTSIHNEYLKDDSNYYYKVLILDVSGFQMCSSSPVPTWRTPWVRPTPGMPTPMTASSSTSASTARCRGATDARRGKSSTTSPRTATGLGMSLSGGFWHLCDLLKVNFGLWQGDCITFASRLKHSATRKGICS